MVPPLSGIDEKSPAIAWSHQIAADNAVTFPRHSGLDVYGVVLKGTVKVRGAEAQKGSAAKEWTAFHAPGGGVSIAASGGPARVMFAVVSGGEAAAEAGGRLAKDAAKLSWKERPAPIELVDLGVAKDLSWAGGSMHARIGFEGDKQRASLGVLIASKDASVAQHQHDTSWEVLAALRAGGTMKRAAQPGGTALTPSAIADGAVVLMPKGVAHAWVPGNTKPLVAIQLYVPPGPEQRFKKLAETVGTSPKK
jgi:hypothetical protein